MVDCIQISSKFRLVSEKYVRSQYVEQVDRASQCKLRDYIGVCLNGSVGGNHCIDAFLSANIQEVQTKQLIPGDVVQQFYVSSSCSLVSEGTVISISIFSNSFILGLVTRMDLDKCYLRLLSGKHNLHSMFSEIGENDVF